MKTKAQIGEITLQFNPEQLHERLEATYNEVGIKGVEVAPLDYKSGSGEMIELPILLDGPTSGKGNSIEDQIKTLKSYTKKWGDTNAPPILDFVYGKTLLPVVVLSVDVIDRFRDTDDASRTRALITLTIREYREHEYHRTPREEKGDRIYITGPKSTFRSISLVQYQNGELEKVIIARNPAIMLDMVGPLIPPGRTVIIPSWTVAKEYIPEPQSGGLVRYA